MATSGEVNSGTVAKGSQQKRLPCMRHRRPTDNSLTDRPSTGTHSAFSPIASMQVVIVWSGKTHVEVGASVKDPKIFGKRRGIVAELFTAAIGKEGAGKEDVQGLASTIPPDPPRKISV